jgi:hypothetical protein
MEIPQGGGVLEVQIFHMDQMIKQKEVNEQVMRVLVETWSRTY